MAILLALVLSVTAEQLDSVRADSSPLNKYAAWSASYHRNREIGTMEARISGQTRPFTADNLLKGGNVTFVGRAHKGDDDSVSFDMNGFRIEIVVTGTTGLSVVMSQIQKIEDNVFQVFLNGVLQPQSRFNTSSWTANKPTTISLFPTGTLETSATYNVAVVKDTEPQFAGKLVTPNYITFYGFTAGANRGATLLAPNKNVAGHKIEFLGDSITAGFDNQCDIPNAPRGFPWSESFTKSWATGICDELAGECHYNAWSGFGMVANCCGGSTLASDVWMRTLATVGSNNASDPHGTTPENEWKFSEWIADAVVINLGTNDHLGTTPTPKKAAYRKRYFELVTAASAVYGEQTRFFLACGPMATDYCTDVLSVIDNLKSSGIKAYLLDQRGFDSGQYGKDCAYGHPSSSDDAAMARNGSAYIRNIMGW